MDGSQGPNRRMTQEEVKKAEEQIKLLDKTVADLASKMTTQGASPKDAMGVTSTYLENIYSQAYRLYNTGKYSEATHLFRLLVLLNAMEPKYTLGLAACSHMLKDYNTAIQLYTLSSTLDPQNPVPHYHTSDCFIQMKDYLSAMICLELAINRAGDNPSFSKMKERAQLSLDSLKQNMGSISEDAAKPMQNE